MALTLEVDGVDILDEVREGSLSIEETGLIRTAILDFDLLTPVGLDNEQTVEFKDGSTEIFTGRIRSIHRNPITQRRLSGVWATIHCLDATVFPYDKVIKSTNGLRKVDETDKERIEFFFDFYMPSIDATTANVHARITHMPRQDYTTMSLGTMMDNICKVSGSHWYVDPRLVLFYLPARDGFAAFDLSDEPDNVTTFGYRDLEPVDENTQLNNALYTRGRGISNRWYFEDESIARYGRLEGFYTNRKIHTRDYMDMKAARLLQAQAWPKRGGKLTTFTYGLRPSKEFALTNADYDLSDEPCLIHTVRTRYPTWRAPEYEISFTGKKGRAFP